MKSTQKVTRIKLNIDQKDDQIILGLVSAEADYKLSLALNRKFRISLKSSPPVLISGDNKPEQVFSRFSNIDDRSDLIFTLISNRSGKSFLVNKLKNIDFFLLIQISDKELNLSLISLYLRETDSINAVFNIDLSNIKDKNLHYLTQ